ncbi:uncharacterized protein MELLADRAFT_88932 [Melampsora larici-populina 98AG31]|uniref:Uncharacterized protein n=1 Tax=Melampsora larici-populina (strain 98AG31 / pathotype 3-4-7) TaxID=747676 RepID=F4R6B6_MELLP|nr:uncharacterized protein MELLADRAFT_88932 [Melampsora larici-populina 98AG31]EGG11850.1 hypothetical protein MELLADRAFT_88932 [Melampsora larici-populina 98AG31]
MEARLPDAALLGRFLIAGLQCLTIYDYRRELKEVKEIADTYIHIFTQIDLILFTEIVKPNIEAIVNELRNNANLMAFPRYLLANRVLTKTFIGITLRYLMKHLDELGRDRQSWVMVRRSKMCVMAVTLFQDKELILQPHLSQYYSVLQALFWSIRGGRFEILYKEVLLLLRVLLGKLKKLIHATSDPKERDLFAELCLTVPVRLTVPDLIAQGLCTLEFCVDNLTQDFLNPLIAPVMLEVMATLSPIIDLAEKLMKRNDVHYRGNAFEFVKNITPIFFTMGYGLGEREEVYTSLPKGLFEAARVADIADNAQQHLSLLFEHIFTTEIWQVVCGPQFEMMRYSLTLTNVVMDALLDDLTAAVDKQSAGSRFTLEVFKELFERAKKSPPPRDKVKLLAKRTVCAKASSSCYDHSWPRKCAGHEILSHLINNLDLEMSNTHTHPHSNSRNV